MMGVCMWYARNREEAEEILQDGFLRVFRYIHTYNKAGSLEGWIRSVIISAALSHYRNKSIRMWVVNDLEISNYEPSVEPVFELSYDGKELVKLVQQLPPCYRMVFNLYVFEGLKHREIAALLQISEGTSKSNLSDARRILQNVLGAREIAAR
jgi:RNA polymerase sigma factor (sigma-70 family)